MRLPGLDGDFTVSRRYESVNPRAGLLGQGWTCSAESFLQYKGDACSVLCADGHVEGFHKKDGAWRNDKGGSGKISLAYDAGQNLFVMHDIVTHMSYFYGEGGRLVRVEDGTGHRSQYLYEDGILCGITTFTGLRIGVSVSDGRLRELVDVLGRTVRYEYDDRKRLVRVNQNGRGITRYEYDGKGRITGITDQNNKRYTVNAYDSRGRVTRQDYPDGTCCEISYDDREGSALFYYPETGGRQTAFHNADGLVTRMEYQDGTREEYEYDAWQNRTAHRDRNGNLTRWEYAREASCARRRMQGGLRPSANMTAAAMWSAKPTMREDAYGMPTTHATGSCGRTPCCPPTRRSGARRGTNTTATGDAPKRRTRAAMPHGTGTRTRPCRSRGARDTFPHGK